MSKVFADGSWFIKKYSNSMFEKHYLDRIMQWKESLFPDYWCVKFETDVISNDYGTRKPDLALIDKKYRYWYVVEVELETDNKSHVEHQIKVFSSGKYNDRHAIYLKNQNSDLDLDKLKVLMPIKPTVLMLVPKVKDSWVNSMSQYGCQFMVIEILENNFKNEILRVEGIELIKSDDQFLTDLSFYPGINRALEIKNPASLVDLPKSLKIRTNNEFKTWNVSQWGSKYVLLAEGSIDLEMNAGIKYSLVRNSDGILSLEKKDES
jgi:hypothetical protein